MTLTKAMKHLLWSASATLALLTVRPAAAFTINWGTTNTWQWFGNDPSSPNPLPDYNPQCMDGSDTGIGIYVPSTWNHRVMYWFDGGGYCFDGPSCNNPAISPATVAADFLAGQVPLAPFVFRRNFPYNSSSQTGFLSYISAPGTNGAPTIDINLMAEQKPVLGQGIFDHSPSTPNPFANYLQVFVPYCTGDLHVGAKTDNSSAFGRTVSNIKFQGLYNSTNAVKWADFYIRQHLGSTPSLSVVTGGSAGGFGALLLYGALRNVLPAGEKMVTISDAGTPYFSGTPGAFGLSWSSQGYLGFPVYDLSTNRLRSGCTQYPNYLFPQCASPSQVTYQEAFMADAWGTSWATNYPSAYVSATTPLASPGAFVPIQEVLSYEINHVQSGGGNGDAFHVIDSSNDYVDTWFFSLYPNGQFPIGYTGMSDVYNGQFQIMSTYGCLFQVSSSGNGIGTWAGALPWNVHHGFLTNDTSTWDSSAIGPGGGVGSGVKQFLASIAPAGGW